MLTSVRGLLFGIVLLLAAGTALVSGASAIAARFGVSQAVVGLFVLPLSAMTRPVDIPAGGLLDISSGLVLASVIASIFSFGHFRLNRLAGAAMLSAYFAYSRYRLVY